MKEDNTKDLENLDDKVSKILDKAERLKELREDALDADAEEVEL